MTLAVASSGGGNDGGNGESESFFSKGRAMAEAGQFHLAIDEFLKGLDIDPDNVGAHQELRHISLRRTASGGRSLGWLERRRLGKSDDKQAMLASEKLLAFDPANIDHMMSFRLSAYRAAYHDTLIWIHGLLTVALRDSGQPDPVDWPEGFWDS